MKQIIKSLLSKIKTPKIKKEEEIISQSVSDLIRLLEDLEDKIQFASNLKKEIYNLRNIIIASLILLAESFSYSYIHLAILKISSSFLLNGLNSLYDGFHFAVRGLAITYLITWITNQIFTFRKSKKD